MIKLATLVLLLTQTPCLPPSPPLLNPILITYRKIPPSDNDIIRGKVVLKSLLFFNIKTYIV